MAKKTLSNRLPHSARLRRCTRPGPLVWTVVAALAATPLACENLRGEILYQEALDCLGVNDQKCAQTYLRKMVSEFPNHELAPDAAMRLARLYHFQLRRYESADIAYRELIESYPKSPEAPLALLALADLNEKALGRPQKTMDYLQTFVQRYRNHPDAEQAALHLADLFVQANQLQQAVVEYKQFANRYPKSILINDAKLRQAETLYFLGDSKEATALAQALATDTTLSEEMQVRAQFLGALVQEDAHNLEQAVQTLRDIRYDYPNTHVVQSRIELLLQRIKEKEKPIGRRPR